MSVSVLCKDDSLFNRIYCLKLSRVSFTSKIEVEETGPAIESYDKDI